MTPTDLKKWRTDRGWTQKRMAAEFFVSQRAISLWERDQRPMPGWLPRMISMQGVVDAVRLNWVDLPTNVRYAALGAYPNLMD